MSVYQKLSGEQLLDKHIKDVEALSVPTSFFKFREWGNEYHRQLISNQALWFSSPAQFNDPFDCKIPYRMDVLTEQEFRERVYRSGKLAFPAWSEERLSKEVEEIVKNHPMRSSDEEVRRASFEKYHGFIASDYGILSFAGVLDNILLWSHYADMHRGFCVELDGPRLMAQFVEWGVTDGHFIDYMAVEYQEELPVIVPVPDEEEDLHRFRALFKCKSRAWEYEQEHRFVYVGKTNLARAIAPDIIRRVVCGCSMEEDAVSEFTANVDVSLPKCEIWTAKKSLTDFKLDFKKVR